MRIPRFRLTVGTLMILVAFAALGLGAWVAIMRASRQASIYRATSLSYAVQAQIYRNKAGQVEHLLAVSEIGLDHRREDARDERDLLRVSLDERMNADQRQIVHFKDLMADYCRDLSRKYTLAAEHPWLPVDNDPPPPTAPSASPLRPDLIKFPLAGTP